MSPERVQRISCVVASVILACWGALLATVLVVVLGLRHGDSPATWPRQLELIEVRRVAEPGSNRLLLVRYDFNPLPEGVDRIRLAIAFHRTQGEQIPPDYRDVTRATPEFEYAVPAEVQEVHLIDLTRYSRDGAYSFDQ